MIDMQTITKLRVIQADLDNPDQYKAAAAPTAVAIRTEMDNNSTRLADIEADTTGLDGDVMVGTNNALTDKTGYSLSVVGIDAILDDVIEGTITFRQALRIFLAVLAGKTSGGGTTTAHLRDVADSKDRVLATVDASGNRSVVTLDGE